MNIINVRNVHRALPAALEILKVTGEKQSSRNGDVLRSPGSVTTRYQNPDERVIFWHQRDANPFFHFYESLWMLAGRNDVHSVARFAKNMERYSDDGKTFHGTYGYRWRNPNDQIGTIIDLLKKNPDDRRCILQMWNSETDLGKPYKDVPCNISISFQISTDGKLDMYVFCRSNDIIWGAYGANAVHMSMLQEYMARSIGVPLGIYEQISINWHAYVEIFNPLYEKFDFDNRTKEYPERLFSLIRQPCPYELKTVKPYPIMEVNTDHRLWDRSCRIFCSANGRAPLQDQWSDPFFCDVALPIVRAHDRYKDTTTPDRYALAIKELDKCCATDWKMACTEWIYRRYHKYMEERA